MVIGLLIGFVAGVGLSVLAFYLTARDLARH
jgi:hypothetical protein